MCAERRPGDPLVGEVARRIGGLGVSEIDGALA